MGSYHIGQALGYRNVIASDVGGTSFDLGMVVDASVRSYEFRPIIDRWMVGISMLQTTTMGAGGGSIASINDAARRPARGRAALAPAPTPVRPATTWAAPSPRSPTPTSSSATSPRTATSAASMPLDRDKAVEAIRTRIAEPLGVSVDEAAALIRRIDRAEHGLGDQARGAPARLPPRRTSPSSPSAAAAPPTSRATGPTCRPR